jgi:hypothetical protein
MQSAGKPAKLHDELVKLAFTWQTTYGNGYPTDASGDPMAISTALISKYKHYFAACKAPV